MRVCIHGMDVCVCVCVCVCGEESDNERVVGLEKESKGREGEGKEGKRFTSGVLSWVGCSHLG